MWARKATELSINPRRDCRPFHSANSVVVAFQPAWVCSVEWSAMSQIATHAIAGVASYEIEMDGEDDSYSTVR